MTSQKSLSTLWDTGIEHEALRLIYYLKRLPERELQNRGFLILPRPPKKESRRTIVFPNLDYSSVKNIWTLTSHLPPTTPMNSPGSLVRSVTNLLKDHYSLPEFQFEKLKKSWQSNEGDFFNELWKLLPHHQNRINSIHFIVTNCGTISQFNLITTREPHLTIYLRADAAPVDIAQSIILSLIRSELQNRESKSWEEIESISDFLLHHTSLSRFFKTTPISMMSLLRQKQSGKLVTRSNEYLASLGIPTENCWRIEDDDIYFQDKKINRLTTRQEELLKCLIRHHGSVVTLDTIASILWPREENFSLWAIVKEVARIREQLKRSYLPGSLIQSHRKLGYSLI